MRLLEAENYVYTLSITNVSWIEAFDVALAVQPKMFLGHISFQNRQRVSKSQTNHHLTVVIFVILKDLGVDQALS